MTKRSRSLTTTTTATKSPKKKRNAVAVDKHARCDPRERGIHIDAIRAEAKAPTSRATCVDCRRLIAKDTPRWGIKYAGNPLSIDVLPLFGSHPMYMWCHAGCGLAYCRLSPEQSEAAKTCHACQDSPDLNVDGGLRLLCGGSSKEKKVQNHAFHLKCWYQAIQSIDDESAKGKLLVSPQEIGNRHGLSWKDLTKEEQNVVLETYAAGVSSIAT